MSPISAPPPPRSHPCNSTERRVVEALRTPNAARWKPRHLAAGGAAGDLREPARPWRVEQLHWNCIGVRGICDVARKYREVTAERERPCAWRAAPAPVRAPRQPAARSPQRRAPTYRRPAPSPLRHRPDTSHARAEGVCWTRPIGDSRIVVPVPPPAVQGRSRAQRTASGSASARSAASRFSRAGQEFPHLTP